MTIESTLQPFDSLAYLTDVIPSLFQNAFENVNTIHTQAGGLVMEAPSGTEQNIYTFLAQSISMSPWQGERQVRELAGHEFTVVNDDFELTYGIKKDKLEDLSRILGISMYIERMGQAAGQHKDKQIWEFLKNEGTTAICFDGTPLIGALHPLFDGSTFSNFEVGVGANPWYLLDTTAVDKGLLYQTRTPIELEVLNADEPGNERGFLRREHLIGAWGRSAVAPGMPQRIFKSEAVLDAAGFSAARASMRSLKGDGGEPMLVRPNVLMVSPQDETTALELMQAERNSSGATNILRGAAQVVVNEFLTP